MKKLIALAIIAMLVPACAMQYKKTEQEMKQPINCATAEGDLRALQSEKTNVAQQIAAGVTSIVPVGLVVGLVTGTAGAKWNVTTGEYNKMIDQKIAEIKQTCNVQ
jgi:hypothetical protein